MKKKPVAIVPVAAALAALAGSNAATASSVQADKAEPARSGVDTTIKSEPNLLLQVGEDLLGFIVTRNADGTVVAQGHYSHTSHASHASHRSHYSSRY